MSNLSPVIWLNENGRAAFNEGRPVGRDQYGYFCAADDPLCVEPPSPGVEAALRLITKTFGIERSRRTDA